MVKNKNKNKKNEKYVGLGTSLENSFVLYNHARGFVTSKKHETACCCLLVRWRQHGEPSARQEFC